MGYDESKQKNPIPSQVVCKMSQVESNVSSVSQNPGSDAANEKQYSTDSVYRKKNRGSHRVSCWSLRLRR
jgi:hypothetical protein